MAETTLYPGKAFSPQATLTDRIGAADTIIKVSDVSAFPDAPNLATIGTDEDGETILYTAKTADALSGCQRGVEGTARAWDAGELIGRNFTAKDHNDLIAAVTAAQQTADGAAGDASEAKETAGEAKSTADTAKSTAETAKSTAEGAATTAGQAKTAAEGAASAASEAKSTAEGAASTANAAASTAAGAASTANEAKETAAEALAAAEKAGGLYPQIIVTTQAGDVVTVTKGTEAETKTAEGTSLVFMPKDYGTYNVKGTRNGVASSVVAVVIDTVAQYEAELSYFSAEINVTSPAGSSLTCTGGGTTQTKTSTGSDTFTVTAAATYTITATDGTNTASGSVAISASGESKSLELSYVHIYSVSWDGSSTTKLTRGDDAALFTDPVPAVGTGSGSSPFDNLLPWSGMTRVTDGNNVLVKIPKFWVKVSHNPFKIQIADKAVDGFEVSPAHRDRGDGAGERDVVYIGRYECDGSYMSRSGQAPGVSKDLATFRSGIAALGSEYWQADYMLQLTWWYLYLVEFADWDGQSALARGYVDGNSAAINTGGTDSMTYHTGRAAGTDGKTAIQYRNIENPWGNVREWRDGIIFNGANICIYLNPSLFKSEYNGTGAFVLSFTRPTSDGWIKAWGHDDAHPGIIYPNEIGGSSTTYVPDYCYRRTGLRALNVGGNWNSGDYAGPFYLNGNDAPTNSYADLGSRLQKLPSAA